MIADGGQFGGRQLWRACEALTATEHKGVATLRQRGGTENEVLRRVALDGSVGIGGIIAAEEAGEVHGTRQHGVADVAGEAHHVAVGIDIGCTLDLVAVAGGDVTVGVGTAVASEGEAVARLHIEGGECIGDVVAILAAAVCLDERVMYGYRVRVADGDGASGNGLKGEGRGTVVTVSLCGSLCRPAFGYATDTVGKVAHLRHLDESTRGGHAVEPFHGGVVAEGGGEALYITEVGAVAEHHFVGIGWHDAGRQVGSLCQGGAAVEHHGVAACGQCGGGQLWGFSQAGASAEHIVVAIVDQCGGRQLWGCGQAGATVEHTAVAVGLEGGGWQY